MDTRHESEPRWWEIHRRGTLANFGAKVAMTGVMLLFVGERLIDHSKNTVEPVINSNTELIRKDLQQPVREMRESARNALAKLEGMEQDVAELKDFISEQFGVDFED
jgi:hypothetical protein